MIISKQISSAKKEVDLIEQKRALKRWKQSISHYYLHPEKYKFGLRNLK
ncbi:MAG: hypothetical protein ACFE91_00325 [Promethearchaeota archaeon]